MHVLVTGGSGFIGRAVVLGLLEAGHTVSTVDRQPAAHPDTRHTEGELTDAAVRDRAFGDGVDVVVHLAAETSVLGSVEHPAQVHQVNVEASAGLLELARTRGASGFVLASTNAVVGSYDGMFTEDVPLAPLTPYGATKAAVEMLMSGYAGAFGLRTPALRLSNVYGPGMRAKDSFIPRLCRAAASGELVQIYGDGLQSRDLVHVEDVARAFALAVEGWPSGPVIIGSGESHTVLDLVDAARSATGRPIAVEHIPAKVGEISAVTVDVSRARGLGWEPSISLAEGMRSAWADFIDG